ncbi:ADP-heptose:LPS heptosyltransferase [Actinacidiphila alni]|uniref:ADP-heptose:LPS heptosyltransferase n=1 Tax=Actinacidiphila alni TaxID=380248 RepID=A0A1I2JW91_9ACTN|nr:glycosyltransferase family 9 protein [Actinacidiphila alni]SFF59105.1 ADP-heptose:LPS heptosyltransferase [Actinacidiphila alni]
MRRRRPVRARRLLVLRALGLGDLLAGVPALRGLRRAFPAHELVLAAPEGLREAAAATEAVDTVFPAEAPGRGVPSLRHWTGPPPDVAVDLHGNGPESHRALAELDPRRLLSFARPGTPPDTAPRRRSDEHERTRWCRLLWAYGIPADPSDLRLRLPTEPSPVPDAVVVHPGANAAARRWPAWRYAAVVRQLRAAGLRVVVSGGPGDGPTLDEVGERAWLTGEDFAYDLPFARFAALVAHAAVFVSADTGPAHLAVAYGTPSVTLFGPVAPRLWGPPPDKRHTVLWHEGAPGDPNGRRPDRSLLRVRVAEVVDAALARVREPAVPGPGGLRHVR